MTQEKLQGLIVADFTVDNFSGYIKYDEEYPLIDTVVAPYGQVQQIIMDSDNPIWKQNYKFWMLWTRPEALFKTFKQALSYEKISHSEVLSEVESFCALIKNVAAKFEFGFVSTWIIPSYYRGFGPLDMKKDLGISNLVYRMNLRLSECLDEVPNLYLLNSQRWAEVSGKNASNPKLWYMGKVCFDNEVFKQAVKDIKASIRGILGESKKLIILDLDDTLWGGIVGDDGWENLQLGGHDPVGEAFLDFQAELKALTNRGILLGIVSKNDEQIAMEAIEKHPEMLLKAQDFVGWRINWNDKAQNIADLVTELNLGLQSVVFIDDNPVERARVSDMLPEVLVPEWPKDKMLYRRTLLQLRCFDAPALSQEDSDRSKMYLQERQRKALQSSIGSVEEWLKTLDLKVTIDILNETNLPRTAQLLNKTNQMNLTTRRMPERELYDWAQADHRALWTFRVEDKFGDSGLTGIISIEAIEQNAQIIDFILSCRVMGRNIENVMLQTAINYCRSKGINNITAKHVPTAKNKPCLECFKQSGFTYDNASDTFYWSTQQIYDAPDYIDIIQPHLDG